MALLRWAVPAAILITGMPTDAQMVRECQLPEVARAWHQLPVSFPTVQRRDAGDMAAAVAQPYRVNLSPCAAEWCKPGSYAAMVKMRFSASGRYRVAVDQMLWVDVYSQDTTLEGVLCEHSGCDPIRKIVQFDVSSGDHWVVAESKWAGEFGLLVTKVGP
jgi:hypothetical protein